MADQGQLDDFLAALETAGRPSANGQRTKGGGKDAAKDKSLEAWIWDAACSIRGAKDAPKYKDYILPLIFTKRLCDVFDDELNRIAEQVGSHASVFPTSATGNPPPPGSRVTPARPQAGDAALDTS